jgi:hypothetical protein
MCRESSISDGSLVGTSTSGGQGSRSADLTTNTTGLGCLSILLRNTQGLASEVGSVLMEV